MSLASLLNNLMDVYRVENPQSLSGGMKVVQILKESDVACRITDEHAGQQVLADGRNQQISHSIYTFYDGMVNGDTVIETATARRFRFLAPKTRRAAGNIPQFQVLLFQEIRN